MGAKIAVLIPDRGDRTKFLINCLKMAYRQSLTPAKVLVVDFEPVDGVVDITKRYREGYNQLTAEGKYDLIAFMENDDWYSPDYLKTMVDFWEKNGRLDLLGLKETIYYHLKLKKYFTMKHPDRSSAMNTLIKPGLEIVWPKDHDPYTDQWLWMRENIGIKTRLNFIPEKIICLGMKHNIGLTGGEMHSTKLHRYTKNDNGFLERTVDPYFFKFYSTLQINDK